MPRAAKKAKITPKTKAEAGTEKFDFDEEENAEEFGENQDPNSPVVLKSVKKRPYEEDEDDELPEPHIDGEMQSMLQSFGADMRKSMTGKRKRLESFTQQTLKAANGKLEKVWKLQQTERQRLKEEYNKQLNTVLEQWETDIKKMKEQEEKLQNMFKQQQRLMQQSCVAVSQRLKNVRQLFDQYNKTVNDLENCHKDQQGGVCGELRKEMSLLHKKILMDTVRLKVPFS
ncbi:Synaptonemal complex protein 3 [Holothuria leucospilota]|uniref:Synaptonemal complex protein 3 n=1 Tax=Holothuria leucospilota TaxID=206669 RepID=A0A9Q0YKB9_HOLLE|nr:Synaptonemal complex protein 3 [Holothuria leucospilota]